MTVRAITDWFDPKVKPVHVGVYLRRTPQGQIWWPLWNGRRWMCTVGSVAEAAR